MQNIRFLHCFQMSYHETHTLVYINIRCKWRHAFQGGSCLWQNKVLIAILPSSGLLTRKDIKYLNKDLTFFPNSNDHGTHPCFTRDLKPLSEESMFTILGVGTYEVLAVTNQGRRFLPFLLL